MVSVINITETSMKVIWGSHGTNVAHYNIELRYGPTEWGDLVPGKQVYGITSSAREYGFINLEPGRQYHVKLYSKDSAQNTIKIEMTTFWTDETTFPTPSAPTLNVSASGRTIYISGSKGSNTDYIVIYVDGSFYQELNVVSSSSYSTTYTGSYSRTYTIRAVPEDRYGVEGTYVQRSVTTGAEPLPDPPPAPGNFNIYNQGETWASFAWNWVSSADKYAMEIWRGGSRVDYDYNITERTKTFTGLSPGVDYQAKLYAHNAGGNGTPTYLNFRLGYDRPANFSWTITKANNRAYSRNSLGQLTNFMTAQELQNFQARINDFRKYKGLSTYSFTLPARGQEFTASMYNQLRTAISNMNPPTAVPAIGYSGTNGVVDKLNDLVKSLNSIS